MDIEIQLCSDERDKSWCQYFANRTMLNPRNGLTDLKHMSEELKRADLHFYLLIVDRSSGEKLGTVRLIPDVDCSAYANLSEEMKPFAEKTKRLADFALYTIVRPGIPKDLILKTALAAAVKFCSNRFIDGLYMQIAHEGESASTYFKQLGFQQAGGTFTSPGWTHSNGLAKEWLPLVLRVDRVPVKFHLENFQRDWLLKTGHHLSFTFWSDVVLLMRTRLALVF